MISIYLWTLIPVDRLMKSKGNGSQSFGMIRDMKTLPEICNIPRISMRSSKDLEFLCLWYLPRRKYLYKSRQTMLLEVIDRCYVISAKIKHISCFIAVIFPQATTLSNYYCESIYYHLKTTHPLSLQVTTNRAQWSLTRITHQLQRIV